MTTLMITVMGPQLNLYGLHSYMGPTKNQKASKDSGNGSGKPPPLSLSYVYIVTRVRSSQTEDDYDYGNGLHGKNGPNKNQ